MIDIINKLLETPANFSCRNYLYHLQIRFSSVPLIVTFKVLFIIVMKLSKRYLNFHFTYYFNLKFIIIIDINHFNLINIGLVFLLALHPSFNYYNYY